MYKNIPVGFKSGSFQQHQKNSQFYKASDHKDKTQFVLEMVGGNNNRGCKKERNPDIERVSEYDLTPGNILKKDLYQVIVNQKADSASNKENG